MGRFNYTEVENYGNESKSSFFSLKDDGDIARVRFMYNGIEDVEGYAVHEIMLNEKRRYVNCLRSYKDPKNKCPFCNSGSLQRAKLYVPLYDEDTHEVKLWERGKRFFSEISSLCSRYSSADEPLVSQIFEIERRGKKGDKDTTYGIFPVGRPDDTRLEDLPEIPNVIGSVILDKTAEEMEIFLEEGDFPSMDKKTSGENYRRRETSRRTPTSNRSDNEF